MNARALVCLVLCLYLADDALADDAAVCAGDDPGQGIPACTHVIADSEATPAALAAAYAARGRFYLQSGDAGHALADLDGALRIDPDHVNALISRGAVYVKQGKVDLGLADYAKAISLDPNNAEAYANRGGIYATIRRLPEAKADLDKAIALDPDNSLAYFNRGVVMFVQGQFDAAIADFDQALRVQPNNGRIYFERSVAYMMSGHFDQAMADVEKSIQLDPDYAQAYGIRGALRRDAGQRDAAIADFRHVLAIDPSNAGAAAALAELGVTAAPAPAPTAAPAAPAPGTAASPVASEATATVANVAAPAAPPIAEPQETDLVDVTAQPVFLRQYGGVLHLGIVLHNAGTTQARASMPVGYGDVAIIDAKANKKYSPLRDANGHFLAGPISDWNDGGRWFPQLEPKSDTLLWVLFDAVPDDTVTAEGPLFHSFDDVAVGQGPPQQGSAASSSVPPLRASVLSAKRRAGELAVRLKIVNPENVHIGSHTLAYSDVYALDPAGKRSYPLLKGSDGLFLASPMADKNDGGRWFLAYVPPNGQTLLDLTFQAPPDDVQSVDVIVPWFSPFEAVAISGAGGAAPSGIAVAGRATGLERALRDLHAEVTPQTVKVDLAADVLFDFDKADLKPEAEPELARVETILASYPNARVAIDGYTDSKGSDAYNLQLSQARAANVATWLRAHGTGAALTIHGWGRANPIAPNSNPDGSDNPEGRARNRRVEITLTK